MNKIITFSLLLGLVAAIMIFGLFRGENEPALYNIIAIGPGLLGLILGVLAIPDKFKQMSIRLMLSLLLNGLSVIVWVIWIIRFQFLA